MKTKILFFFIFLFLINTCAAYEQPISFDTPRTLSLGSAFSALSTDASAIFYNPAGSAYKNKEKISMEFGGFYQNYEWDSDSLTSWNDWNDFGGYILYWENQGIFSATMRELGSTKSKLPVPNSDSEAKPTLTETTVGLTTSEQLNETIYVGFKGIYVNLKSDFWDDVLPNKHIGIFDVGVIYKTRKQLNLGFTTTNLMTTDSNYLIFDDFGNYLRIKELPKDINISLSFQPSDYAVIIAETKNLMEQSIEYPDEVTAPEMNLQKSYHFGIEMWFSHSIAVRGGFNYKKIISNFNDLDKSNNFIYSHRSNFSVGIGVQKEYGRLSIGTEFCNLNSKIAGNPNKYNVSLYWNF